MEKVRIEDVENAVQPAAVMRHLTEPLGATDFAMNYYELEPGDSFAFAYHRHEVQEEVFYVQSGDRDLRDGRGRRRGRLRRNRSVSARGVPTRLEPRRRAGDSVRLRCSVGVR